MASDCELLVEGGVRAQVQRLVDLAAAEAWRVEDKFSRYQSGNIIHRINHAAGRPVRVDDETARMFDYCEQLFELSEGKFDITSGVLRRVWSFDGSDRLPSAEAVEKVLADVGWQRVGWDGREIQLQPGMQVDLGGVGKEYAVDRVAAIVADASPLAALVNLGGDLAVARGRREGHWSVGIEQMERRLPLREGGLATSGDARRFLERDGVRYSHILDPTTGWPIVGAPRSITVAAASCTQAGVQSTLAMLQGERARDFLQEQEIPHWILD